jgi:hypothetical protein
MESRFNETTGIMFSLSLFFRLHPVRRGDNMLENKECWQQDCVFSIPQRIRWIMNGTAREGAESFLVDLTNATVTSVAAIIS